METNSHLTSAPDQGTYEPIMNLPLPGRRQPLSLPAELVVTSSLTIPLRADPRMSSCAAPLGLDPDPAPPQPPPRRVQRQPFSDHVSLLFAIRLRRLVAGLEARARGDAFLADWPLGACDAAPPIATVA